MSGLYYLLSIVAVFVVVQWFIRNDAGDGTGGILAVRTGSVPKKQKKERPKWTRDGAQR